MHKRTRFILHGEMVQDRIVGRKHLCEFLLLSFDAIVRNVCLPGFFFFYRVLYIGTERPVTPKS